MTDANDRPFTRAELKAVQDDYELNTGERPSLEVASVLLDRQREADSYRDEYTVAEALEDFELLNPYRHNRIAPIKPTTYEERGDLIETLCAQMDDLDKAGRDKAAEAMHEDLLQDLLCAQRTCGHYVCTGGEDLAEWEYNQRAHGDY